MAIAEASPRTERAAVTLTKEEKDAVRLVAMVEKTDESSLFRAALPKILKRAHGIRVRLGDA